MFILDRIHHKCPTFIMDLNYKVESWPSKLRTMCMVSTISHTLKAAGVFLESDVKVIASQALERIAMLEVPRVLITEMSNITEVIMVEMLKWHKENPGSKTPVLTPQGTVDLSKSIRAHLDSDTPVISRFVTACNYCYVDDIFNLGKDLTAEDKRQLKYCDTRNYFDCNSFYECDTLPIFWLIIYEGRFDVKTSLKDLTWTSLMVAFHRALSCHNGSAFNFYVQRASQEAIQHMTDIPGFDFRFASAYQSFSPDIYVTWFSLLSQDERENLHAKIFARMLISLLEWPFQNLFLKAAKTLTKRLDAEEFWNVATVIATKGDYGHKHCNYEELLTGFWRLGAEHQSK